MNCCATNPNMKVKANLSLQGTLRDEAAHRP